MKQTIFDITIDIETYSNVDLKKSGVYRYTESRYFEILTIAVSVNNGKVDTYDIASGEELPLEMVQALLDDKIIKCAHNAIFERICLSEWLKCTYPVFWKHYGRKYLNPIC